MSIRSETLAEVAPVMARDVVETSAATSQTYRFLCIGETWLGSDARAAFAALRRLGHSVEVLDPNHYLPLQWHTYLGRGIRKIFRPVFVRELRLDAARTIGRYKPHCFIIFKGNWVDPKLISLCKQQGVITINYYPDVSFLSHGSYIPRSLPLYDHVFNTKSYGVGDMQRELRLENVSFLEPGYDPDLHRRVELTADDRETYGCDVAFIGTWSPKKESLLAALRGALPDIKIKVWGNRWENNSDARLRGSIMGHGVTGDEYTKAICGSAICLGLLSERGKGSSSGDLITARTFQIPACGVFMLHERNSEVLSYFGEERDAGFFGNSEELGEKVRHYLADDEKREAIARSGLLRSHRDGYSIDGRMKSIVDWLDHRRDTLSTSTQSRNRD